MKTIGAFDAKTNFSKLLEEIARGESFVITKRGKPVASLSPVVDTRGKDFVASLMNFREKHRTSLKKITFEEIVEFKNAGRR